MKNMNKKTYLSVTSVVFLVVALVHGWRVLSGSDLILGEMMIPMWASWVVVLVVGFLAYSGFRLNKG
ncbi:MAG TPA: hypothetical protein VFY28_01360 [Candidatus Paceibacterota bacterium]|nr:hypothetical protein [Candidatus Paceibacterota bacterium]